MTPIETALVAADLITNLALIVVIVTIAAAHRP